MMSAVDELDEFLENPYDDNPFGTDEEKKKRNKEINVEACRKHFPYTLKKDGKLEQIVLKCGYYRECEPCRFDKFEKEIEPRLNYAQNHMKLGDRPRFDSIEEKQRGAYFKKLSRGNFLYYAFPQPDDMLIVVHNDPDGSGDELWDFGYDDHDMYNEDNGLDLNFFTILRDIPEGKKISGNLGKKQDEEPEEGNGQKPEDEEIETYPYKKPFLYKAGLTERDAHQAYRLALVKTLNINVIDENDLQRAMFARINAMADQIKGAKVGFTWDAVTKEEIESWNKNLNNFSDSEEKINQKSDNVRISTNKNTYRGNLDTSNHKTSSFDAVMSRVGQDDGLNNERQEAIQDFLRQHGT